jgi:hypothetical protein
MAKKLKMAANLVFVINRSVFSDLYLLTYLALQPVFGLGLITKVTPFLSIPR